MQSTVYATCYKTISKCGINKYITMTFLTGEVSPLKCICLAPETIIFLLQSWYDPASFAFGQQQRVPLSWELCRRKKTLGPWFGYMLPHFFRAGGSGFRNMIGRFTFKLFILRDFRLQLFLEVHNKNKHTHLHSPTVVFLNCGRQLLWYHFR